MLTLGLNIDTAHVAGRLWTDGPLRSAVVARASDGGQPSDAASAVRDVHDLGLPIGWNAGNRPCDIGGAIDEIPGWLITIAALNLGAPFWFDLLSRMARLRGSGVAEPPRSLSDKAGAKAVEPRATVAPRTLSPRELNRALLAPPGPARALAPLAARDARAHGRPAGAVRAVDVRRAVDPPGRPASATR